MLCSEGSRVMFGNDRNRPLRPVMLVAYADSAHASRCVRYFRRLGWEVHMVAGGYEAQRLAEQLVPHVVVMDVELPDESGWLSCAKITLDQRRQNVVLLAEHASDAIRDRAASVGAVALLRREEAPESLVELIYGQRLAEAV